MPRRKTVADEIKEERQKAARSPRKRKTAPVSEALEEVVAATGMKPATDILRPLEPATMADILASREAKAAVEPESPQAESSEAPFDGEQSRWRDLVDRPRFPVVPDGFMPVASFRDSGIRVSKDTIVSNGDKVSVAAISFAEGSHVPNRQEKDALEDAGYRYRVDRRHRERKGQPGEALGDNTIDAIRLAETLALARREDREQMASVMGRQ